MKTAVSLEPPAIPLERSLTMGDFSELVKARLTLLVVITTGVGFYLDWQGPMNFLALTHAVLGTALAAAGAAALNQMAGTPLRRLDASDPRPSDSGWSDVAA